MIKNGALERSIRLLYNLPSIRLIFVFLEHRMKGLKLKMGPNVEVLLALISSSLLRTSRLYTTRLLPYLAVLGVLGALGISLAAGRRSP